MCNAINTGPPSSKAYTGRVEKVTPQKFLKVADAGGGHGENLPMKSKQSGNHDAMSAVQLSTIGRLMEVKDGG